VQLAPGWRTGANCDQYPRGIGDSGKRVPIAGRHTFGQAKPSVRIPTHEAGLRNLFGSCLVNLCPFQGPAALRVRPAIGEANGSRPNCSINSAGNERAREAVRGKGREVLLRDQPQLQSDMRLAARLIYELTGNATPIEGRSRLRVG